MSSAPEAASYRPPRFDVNVEDEEGAVVLRLNGELDLVSEPVLAGALAGVDGRPLRIDLSDLAFMDSTGLRALLTALREQTDFKLRGPLRPAVERLFELTQTNQIFSFE
ncbi:STAS domain-containing protein [Solirubrobacter phytolaccae]|uniref:STAS domain-containing protein n=1 Tax=Solirubrobacter phytolaccae TaxID=1404360 RepID=A0A9X3N9R3_9ACTN|nr:STAS domain-containing protein [Solirubrobacter phytolaccae]MDA0178692.1 STAS domain-containing protein [Solirubrobacter phytolaccae]